MHRERYQVLFKNPRWKRIEDISEICKNRILKFTQVKRIPTTELLGMGEDDGTSTGTN